jgi:hypothetical protein
VETSLGDTGGFELEYGGLERVAELHEFIVRRVLRTFVTHPTFAKRWRRWATRFTRLLCRLSVFRIGSG